MKRWILRGALVLLAAVALGTTLSACAIPRAAGRGLMGVTKGTAHVIEGTGRAVGGPLAETGRR